MKFNSQFDTEYKYNDDEYFEPDTSETEPGQAIDIKAIYDRCVRGDVLPPIAPPEAYDVKPGMSLDEAFSTVLPNDLDLTDVDIAQQILAEASKGNFSTGGSSEQPTQKASDERVSKVENEASTLPNE